MRLFRENYASECAPGWRENREPTWPGDVNIAELVGFHPVERIVTGLAREIREQRALSELSVRKDGITIDDFVVLVPIIHIEIFSSGENARPFGPVKSFATSSSVPLHKQKTPLNGSSLRIPSNVFDNPNGGSVKYSIPSDRCTRSLGLFRRFPAKLSARTVIVPFGSSRVTRRRPISSIVSRPSRSSVSRFEPGCTYAARASSTGLTKLGSLLDNRFASPHDDSRLEEDITKNLSAIIASSHDLLNDAERVLFRRLARYTNGWIMRGAESVCAGDGLPAHAIADVLASLAEKSLVVAEDHSDSVRYRYLESTRNSARDRLIEAGAVEAIARRHAAWLADLADIAAASELVTPRNLWHLKYRSDLGDAALAADWCLENGHEPVLASRIVAGFRGIWMQIGRRAEIASRVLPALQQIDNHDVKHVAFALSRCLKILMKCRRSP